MGSTFSSKQTEMFVPSRLVADSTTGGAMSGVTVSVATALIALLFGLDATTRNFALSSARSTAARVIRQAVNVVVAPGMLVNVIPSPVSRCQSTVLGGAPVNATEKVKGRPRRIVALAGGLVKPMGSNGLVTGGTPLFKATCTARRN